MKIEAPTKIADLSQKDLFELQSLLSQLGLYSPNRIDGIMGSATVAAWAKFKANEHLGDLNIIGPSSYSLLINLTAESSSYTIDWTKGAHYISKHFTVFEVTQGDERRIPLSPLIQQNILKLARELDLIRDLWDSSIVVTSWYRPTKINSSVGGAKNSQHITGKAADVYPSNGQLARFQDWLDRVAWTDKALGYGARKGFVHLDLRPGRIRWDY